MNVWRKARPPWRELVLVCGKCARKAGCGSFRKDLKKALKHEGMGRHVRVQETSCLDLCPKRRVVLAIGTELGEGRLIVVKPDAANEVAAILSARTGPDKAASVVLTGAKPEPKDAATLGL